MTTPRRVLVVDDDDDVVFLVRDALEPRSAGWIVEGASSFEDAVERLKESWSVVVLDHRLGPRDGLDLLGDARVRHRFPPFVVLTGFESAELDRRALELGAYELLSKAQMDPTRIERSIRYAAVRGELTNRLESRSARLDAIVDRVPVMSWVVDPYGQFEWDDSVPDEMRASLTTRMASLHRRAGASGISGTVEFSHGDRWWDVYVDPASTLTGRRLGSSVGTAVETTRRAERERALQAALQWLQELLDLTSVFGLITDPDGGARFANNALLTRLGRTEDALKDPWFLRDHVETFDDAQDALAATYETGEILPGWTNHFRSVDGTEFEVRWSSVFLHDGDEPIAVASIGEDVSHQRAMENRLRRALRLEQLGRVAGGVTHDFNNFLTVIRGHEEELRSPHLDHEGRIAHLDLLAEATDRAARLASSLLSFGTRIGDSSELVSVGAAVEDLSRLLAIVLSGEISLDVAVVTDHDTVRVDRALLDQILMNLALNARDAIGGRGRIAIRVDEVTVSGSHPLVAEVEPGTYVTVQVSDDGPGVDPSIVDTLFEPLISSKPDGTGLGLATASSAASALGGSVRLVRSGPGASFEVLLPSADPDVGPVEPSASATVPAATVFVVEDDENVRELVRRSLEALHLQVHAFGSPQEALAAVATHRPALLVSDVTMAEMSGLDLAAAARAIDPGLRLLLMSGFDRTMPPERVLGTPAEFLAKPFTIERLRAAVTGLLAAHQDAP
ncbi:MAG: response regulator [Acidimicrobiales bacterium]